MKVFSSAARYRESKGVDGSKQQILKGNRHSKTGKLLIKFTVKGMLQAHTFSEKIYKQRIDPKDCIASDCAVYAGMGNPIVQIMKPEMGRSFFL